MENTLFFRVITKFYLYVCYLMLELPPRLLRAIQLRVELVQRLVIVEQHTGLINVR